MLNIEWNTTMPLNDVIVYPTLVDYLRQTEAEPHGPILLPNNRMPNFAESNMCVSCLPAATSTGSFPAVRVINMSAIYTKLIKGTFKMDREFHQIEQLYIGHSCSPSSVDWIYILKICVRLADLMMKHQRQSD